MPEGMDDSGTNVDIDAGADMDRTKAAAEQMTAPIRRVLNTLNAEVNTVLMAHQATSSVTTILHVQAQTILAYQRRVKKLEAELNGSLMARIRTLEMLKVFRDRIVASNTKLESLVALLEKRGLVNAGKKPN